MPTTPTDPTKAQVWITGEAPNQQFEFYIPRGAKGEPGGITTGTALGSLNLNDVKVAGVYRQDSGTPATLLNSYPIAATGVLYVDDRLGGGSSVMQTYYPWTGSAGINPRQFYKRYLVTSTTWGPWEAYASQRVSETAGRVVYTWDTLNQREQLIYGDTGWRDVIASDGLPGATGYMRIRRTGHVVELSMSATLPDATVSNATLFNIPVGFRPGSPTAVNFYYSRTSAATGQITYGLRPTSVGLEHSAAWSASWGEARLRITWTTDNNWPTTLPGTAYGSIPNL